MYHDALVLMTAKDTIQWMEEEHILDRWILPICGLMEADTDLSRYYGRPPGDSPELMPLDNNLNQDVHLAVNRHVRYTKDLHKDDDKKFSLATPRHGAKAYKRIFCPTLVDGEDPELCGGPTPKRIVQDCQLFPLALRSIYDANGTLTDFANRRGKRAITDEERQNMATPRKENWGGARGRGEDTERWIHPDARDAANHLCRTDPQQFEAIEQDTPEPLEVEQQDTLEVQEVEPEALEVILAHQARWL